MKQFFAFAFFLFVGLSVSNAQWSDNTNVNTPVSTALNDQNAPLSVSDGAGGVIVAWQDYRNDTADIYAQRLNAAGTPLWTINGVPIVTGDSVQILSGIVSDGAGGAIVMWLDTRNMNLDVYAQRVNASGAVLWTTNGVAVCTATGNQASPAITSDGFGGAIITWQDPRSGSFDIYAQRINSSGVAQWTIDGIAISTAPNDQAYPAIASDGAGGAVIAWQDARNGVDWDIFAQRINSSGSLQWGTAATGDSLATTAGDQMYPVILGDGSGGAIVTWTDTRNDPGDIYAQRLNSSGVSQWTKNGTVVSAATGIQRYPKLVSDGAGGAVIAWQDDRVGTNNIYAQRVNAAGAVLWTQNGNSVCVASGNQELPALTSDGTGGAIITWEDFRSASNYDIYAQRVSASGLSLWTNNGVLVSGLPNDQWLPVIVGTNAAGAIITWQDARSGPSDIYAQMIGWNGALGNGTAYIRAIRDVKADQGGEVEVLFHASPYDVWPDETISYYKIWRGVKLNGSTLSKVGVKYSRKTVLRSSSASPSINSTAADTIYWQYAGEVQANYLPAYSESTSTLSDSTAQGIPYYYFMISTYTGSGAYWDSPVDSGYSVDNLPPAIVANVVGSTSSGTETLHWSANTDKDLAGYQVYRSATPGFNPLVMAPYATTTDTTYTDANATGLLYYAVLAVDIHGNLSAKSNEVSTVVSGVDQTAPIPTVFALEQNYPNPFNPSTVITYDVPKTAVVQVTVYDLLGRAVAELVNGEKTPGQYQVVWNADRMSSGIYYVRMQTQGFVATRKVVLMK